MLYLSDFNNGTKISSIQRGIIRIASGRAMNNTIITQVNTLKTEVRFLGYTIITGTDPTPYVYLANSNCISAVRSAADSYNADISWELTEWN